MYIVLVAIVDSQIVHVCARLKCIHTKHFEELISCGVSSLLILFPFA